jgi:hypothetical protein
VDVLLRSWHRVAAHEWTGVLRDGHCRIESPADRFFLDLHFDPGPVENRDYEPGVLLKGYLFDTPSDAILSVLRGESSPDLASMLSADRGDGLGAYGQFYVDWLRSRARNLGDLSRTAFHTLLWRSRVRNAPPGPDLMVEPGFIFWAGLSTQQPPFTTEDLCWRQVPSGFSTLDLPKDGTLDMREDAGRGATQLWAAGTNAPLSHDLARVAWRLRHTDSRASVVMAVAAIETGLKSFVSSRSVAAGWLLETSQSPPVERMLRDLLPTLNSGAPGLDVVPPVPATWHRLFRRAVEIRNKVVHGGPVSYDPGFVDSLLDAVFDFLYFLDFHNGCLWAEH